VTYARPAVEHKEPIAAPFVLGTVYTISPSWTDEKSEDPT
jgi:hypothetical protein